jgi:hypothetical protein
MEFFRLSSFMWTGCFAIHLYQIIWKNIKDPEVVISSVQLRFFCIVTIGYVQVYELRYHLMAWGLPTLVCIYFVAENAEGLQMMGQSDRPWCWIRDFQHDEWNAFGAHLQYALFYGPLLIIFIFNLAIYAFLGRKVVRAKLPYFRRLSDHQVATCALRVAGRVDADKDEDSNPKALVAVPFRVPSHVGVGAGESHLPGIQQEPQIRLFPALHGFRVRAVARLP